MRVSRGESVRHRYARIDRTGTNGEHQPRRDRGRVTACRRDIRRERQASDVGVVSVTLLVTHYG